MPFEVSKRIERRLLGFRAVVIMHVTDFSFHLSSLFNFDATSA